MRIFDSETTFNEGVKQGKEDICDLIEGMLDMMSDDDDPNKVIENILKEIKEVRNKL